MNKRLDDILRRAERWPDAAQAELSEIARAIDAELAGGAYSATPDELAGIDRGLADAEQGRFASGEDVEATFAKHRR